MEAYKISENELTKRLQKFESIACQGNGYLCVRNSLEEDYVQSPRNTFINGVFNAPHGEVEELVSLPDVTNFEIAANGERFDMLSAVIGNYSRTLDMQSGETVRRVLWTGNSGVKLEVEFRRFVSFVKKHIVAEKVIIKPLQDVTLTLRSGIDGKMTNSGVQHFGPTELRAYSDGRIGLCTETLQSKVKVGVQSVLKCNVTAKCSVQTERRGVFVCMTLNAKAGEELVFEKISAYASSRELDFDENDSVEKQNEMYLQKAAELGYDAIFAESAADWEKFWCENAITIESENSFYQQAVNFALYHLRIMANHEDNRIGIGAKALSGEGYKGHSFWDTEIFILPYYIYNAPEIARNLLEYRCQLLDTSRKKAKEYGYSGAMYPWECAWVDDGETCPRLGDMDLETGERRINWMGEKEVHISADIAYAVWHYYIATGDKDFMKKCGCEMILSIAEFWMSRVSERNGRYEILDVIGPDEYKDGIDNNAYTNYMVYFNLRLAQDILANISDGFRQELNKKINTYGIENRLDDVIERLYLPVPDQDGIIPQFDGFRDLKEVDYGKYKNLKKVGTIFGDYSFEEINKMRVCKQADLVMLFYTLRNLFDKETVKRNFTYYENCTLHDSLLSLCIHSLMASRLNMPQTAFELFGKCCEVDLGENTDNSDNGIHSASIGGIWLAVAIGFGGIRAEEDGLKIEPILPKGITSYSLPIIYRGSKYQLNVDADGAKVERLDGEPQVVVLNGKTVEPK